MIVPAGRLQKGSNPEQAGHESPFGRNSAFVLNPIWGETRAGPQDPARLGPIWRRARGGALTLAFRNGTAVGRRVHPAAAQAGIHLRTGAGTGPARIGVPGIFGLCSHDIWASTGAAAQHAGGGSGGRSGGRRPPFTDAPRNGTARRRAVPRDPRAPAGSPWWRSRAGWPFRVHDRIGAGTRWARIIVPRLLLHCSPDIWASAPIATQDGADGPASGRDVRCRPFTDPARSGTPARRRPSAPVPRGDRRRAAARSAGWRRAAAAPLTGRRNREHAGHESVPA